MKKITALKINNMIGARRVDITLQTPVTLFCGANGASKSSVQESVRMAFTGNTFRVDHKKEYPLLVSEGSKTGKATIYTDAGTASFELPSGTHTLDGDLKLGLPDSLGYVLNAQAFASMKAEERRTFLFALTNCKVTSTEVKRRLIEKECEEAYIDMTMPLLRSGFPAAAEFAAKKATDAKGAWRGLTGGTWGSKKAEDWEADKPEVDQDVTDAANAALATIDATIGTANQELGALQAKQRAAENNAAELAKNKALADKLTRLREKLVLDEANLAEYTKTVTELASRAGTGKKAGLVHDLARFLDSLTFEGDLADESDALLKAYTTEHGPINGGGDPEAAAALPSHTKSRDLMKSCADNSRRDVAAAEAAAAWIEVNGSDIAESYAGELDQITQRLLTIKRERNEAAAACDALNAQATAAKNADSITEKAKDHHAEIMAWLKISEQLAPDGVPAEMLAQALKPINTLMREASISTGWRQPAISADMSITAEGRPYSLLSKSEKWRVDAIIAASIAQLSDVRILMLDEVDILELPARVELLMWMDELASSEALNTVLLFATMKKEPTGLPDTIRAIWLENGNILNQESLQAA